MYVLVREDLPPGLRAAQAGHAVAEMCLHYPEEAWEWHTEGNYLIMLGVTGLDALLSFHNIFTLIGAGVFPVEAFHEPDMDNEMTAFACLPPSEMNWIFGRFPLAYKPKSRGLKAWVIRKLGGEP